MMRKRNKEYNEYIFYHGDNIRNIRAGSHRQCVRQWYQYGFQF